MTWGRAKAARRRAPSVSMPPGMFAHRHLMPLLSEFSRPDPDVKIGIMVRVNLSDAIYHHQP